MVVPETGKHIVTELTLFSIFCFRDKKIKKDLRFCDTWYEKNSRCDKDLK